jgi:hypothetical protein
MIVTERYLNQLFKKFIDSLENDEIKVKSYVRGTARLFSKASPIVEIYEGHLTDVSYPKDALYRGPKQSTMRIVRIDKLYKEYCTTRVVDAGDLTDYQIKVLEAVTSWQFIGTDRWKAMVELEDYFTPTPTVVYEQDDEELDDDVKEGDIPMQHRLFRGKPKGVPDGMAITEAEARVLSLSKPNEPVYTEVLVPIHLKPDYRSELIMMKDGMLVLLVKHVNIATGEKILYRKVVYPELYYKAEVERIEVPGKWS